MISILHVGMPKCGSSALQTSLCGRPLLVKLDEPRKVFEYVVATEEGRLLRGVSLRRSAELNPVGYETSDSFERLAGMDSERAAVVCRTLEQMHLAGHIPVLSNENWYRPDEAKHAQYVVHELGLAPVAILLIRPPADWINSMWFQEGIWCDYGGLDDYLDLFLSTVRIDQVVDAWSSAVGAENLHIRIASKGAVAAFTSAVGAGGIVEPQVNRSLPAAVIELMRGHDELRPSPDSADLKWTLDRFGLASDLPQPWAMTQDQVERVLDAWKPGLEKAAHFMVDADVAALTADRRWWDPQAYEAIGKNRLMVESAERRLQPHELEQLIKEVLMRLLEVDELQRASRQDRVLSNELQHFLTQSEGEDGRV